MLRTIEGIPVYGDPVDEGAMTQIKNCAKDAWHVALMGDHHKGYNMPIGGVAAYFGKVAPAGVGYDIACGNKAVRLDCTLDDIRQDLPRIADAVWTSLSFGVGRSNAEPVDHALFDSPTWTDIAFLKESDLKRLAAQQLGTIGSGNHYCDVFADEMNRVWVGVHFGSRGLGHKIASEYMEIAGGRVSGSMDDAPSLLKTDSCAGSEYLVAMELAGQYAYAGRDWVCAKVAEIIGAKVVEEIHNHHNYAWQETHFGESYWVVRKGATPAFPGQKGFVGGSMGDESVILEGVDSEESAFVLYSTVHGAGRVMSRTQAAGKVRWVKGKKVHISEGVVNMEAVRERLKNQGLLLRGAGADEAPEVYKRLPEVLEHHSATVKVLHRLQPLIVCMAGADENDPYKD